MLEININENSQDKIQILCVIAVFLFLAYKLCMGLGVLAIDTLDLLDTIKITTYEVQVGNMTYLEQRIGSKYQKGLPDDFVAY
jgi:hypothetical protein